MDTEAITENGKTNFLWKRAWLPAALAVCAFVCFAAVYWELTVKSLKPLYLLGLVFLVPSLLIGLIAYAVGREKLNFVVGNVIAVILALILASLCSAVLILISLFQTSGSINDPRLYKRTMNFGDNMNREVLALFPEDIPLNAKNIEFRFVQLVWLDYSLYAYLQYSISESEINEYIETYEEYKTAENEEIINLIKQANLLEDTNFEVDGYDTYTVIDHNNKISAILINSETNSIIFFASEMRQ